MSKKVNLEVVNKKEFFADDMFLTLEQEIK